MSKPEIIRENIRAASRAGRLSHAYIISGDSREARSELASFLVRELLGRTEADRSRLEAGTHPDLTEIRPEKASVGVEEIRRQIGDTVSIRPYLSEYRIYVLYDSDKMTPQAQNALLKTIEEPPSYAVLLLLTDRADSLLETIRSRCIDLRISEEEEEEGSETFAAVLRNLDTMTAAAMTAAVASVRESAPAFIEFCRVWFRDLMVYKQTGAEDRLILKEEADHIIRQSHSMDYAGMDRALTAMDEAQTRLQFNVNQDLTLKLMLLALR